MKRAIYIPVSVLVSAFMLFGCMTDKEYQLRKAQLVNQANHPTTYEVLSVEGPVKVEIAQGGKARVTVPNQPFREIQIPDGVKTQAELVQHLIDVGAISVLGWKAIDEAKGTTKTYKTVNKTVAPVAP